ncbi:hypothetical protein [Jiella avicenniae]|uniref:Uncharacterized protein n=1 Tax=Jiella avicenniae TaxID=2907202 RepID=A0A9X1P1E6_9HYPH|nr:hypothetical protein [Jiella avicenniae]MCE7028321.1 hypothetical protein [Jiella avicenniae]
MADLSGVLRKTIDGLPRATPQMREKVYEKARAAIQRQIGAASPPLADNVVAARLAALEDAITRTEEHYVAQEAAAAEQAGAPASPAPAAAAEPAAPKPAGPVPPPAQPAQPAPTQPAPVQPAQPPRPQPPAAAQPAENRPAPAPQPGPAAGPAPQSPPPQRPAPEPAKAAPAQPLQARPDQGPPKAEAPAPSAPKPAPQPRSDAPAPAAPQQRSVEAGESPRPQQQPAQARPSLPAATMPGQAAARTPDGVRDEGAFFPPETAEPDAGDQPPAIGAPFLVPEERDARPSGGAAPGPAAHETPRDDDFDGDLRVPHDIRVDDNDIPEADVSAPRYSARRSGRSSGRAGKVAAAAAVVLLLGAAGTAGWIYRDDIEALLVTPADIGTIAERSGTEAPPTTNESAPAPGETESQTASAEEPPASTRRFTQRLLPDGTEVDEGPAQKTPNAFDEGTNVAAATNVDTNAPPAGATPTISSEIGEDPAIVGGETEAPGVAAPEAGADAESPAGVATDSSASTPSAAPDAAPGENGLAVAQKAVFYQEKTEDLPGTQETGTVVWSLVDEPGADGASAEPAVRAVVDVPEEKLKMTMTIKRNADSTLPASHVIELEFDVPQDFSGRSVANVQRLALKETEQARGEPLIGVAGKISDNYFIIALNNLDQAVQNNLALLENQKWIDIPIAYQSGRRALISIEKGIPGERVFKDALKAWQAKT